jgi:hypothetical protein
MGLKRFGEWIPFDGKGYIRHHTAYGDMEWSVAIADALFVVPAPFGGPIAVVEESDPRLIQVFNAAGRHLFSGELPTGDIGRITAVGWSNEETLVVITSKPACFLWLGLRREFFAVKLPKSTVGADLSVSTVKPGGCILGFGTTVCAVLFQEKREPLVVDATIDNLDGIYAADIIEKHFFEMETPVLVVAGRNAGSRKHSLVGLAVDGAEVQQHVLGEFPSAVRRIATSPDGKSVCVAVTGGAIVVIPTVFAGASKTVFTGVDAVPEALHWCGGEYVHLLYSGETVDDSLPPGHFSIILRAEGSCTHRERVEWDIEGSGMIAACAEVDGLRVVSDTTNHFYQVVPQSLRDIFARDSKALTAQVCRASDLAASHSVEGITKLGEVCSSPAIVEAIGEILDAASYEMERAAQEQLLAVVARARSSGRVRLRGDGEDDEDEFVDVSKRIRMLNSVRSPEGCAVPISHEQYRTLSGVVDRGLKSKEALVLVDRLVQRGEYKWAVNVADFMGMKVDKILVQWSVAKVSAATDELAAYKEIAHVLQKCPSASFTDAALEAAAQGKQQLALRLLDAEPRSQSQVLLLLQMGLDDIAMEKAVASSDADLTYLVLLKLMHRASQPAFYAALKRYEAARMQFLAASQHSPPMARRASDFLLDLGSERYVAIQRLVAAFQPPPRGAEEDAAEPASGDDAASASSAESHVSGRRIAGTNRITPELTMEAERLLGAVEGTREDARLCAVHRDLIAAQNQLIEQTGETSIINGSLVATVRHALLHGLEAEAEDLRRRFNMNDKKFWYTKLLTLADSAQWDALERMGGTGRYPAVKSPIGFLPFVETLFERGEGQRAVPFVGKLPGLVQRVEWYVKLDEFQLAVDDAYNDDNVGMLQQIRQRSRNPTMLQYIDERIKALR